MDEHLNINLKVANRTYPIRVRRDEEQAYRRATDEINFKLGQYKSHFNGADSQPLKDADYMAMTAIQAVVDKAKIELQVELYQEEIEKLKLKLEEYIKINIR